MNPLEPSTLTRLSLEELSGVPLAGGPSSARCMSARDGKLVELERSGSGFDIRATAAVDLVTVSWEMGGVEVCCEVQVVPSRYCTLDDIRKHRADELQNMSKTDEDVFEARARAEDVIERECGRALQPVMETCWVDRPNCSTRSQLIGRGGSLIRDLIDVPRAVDAYGREVDVRVVRPGGPFVDVSSIGAGSSAEASVVHGLEHTPSEVRPAVAALAARFLTARAEPDNAVSMTGDGTTINYVVEGASGITALPEVNALIKRYRVVDYLVG